MTRNNYFVERKHPDVDGDGRALGSGRALSTQTMQGNHLFDLIRSAAPEPDRPFARLADGRRVTYRDLMAASGRFAGALRRLGVGVGDRVAVQVEKSVDALALYLACLRCGAIFSPLNTAYTNAEIGYFLADADPALFVCDPGRLDACRAHLSPAPFPIVTLGAAGDGGLAERARDCSAEFEDATAGPDAPAAILYTSGTTGRSKGAVMTHRNLAANAVTLARLWAFTRNDRLIHALPIYHSHGLFVATNVTLFSGASLLFFPKFEPGEIIAALPHATVMMGVPTHYTRLLQESDLDRAAVTKMRLFISGSAPLRPETHHAWQARTGHAILERYGMTETNMNASNPYEGPRTPGSVGLPLPDVEIRIVDPETGAPAGNGVAGMVEVRGPNVFKGYWRRPEKTIEEFRADGFFVTGDIGRFDAAGYLYLVGRAKDLIITGGLNVYPREIEAEIDAMPNVAESAVIGLPHDDFGEAVTAIIVPCTGVTLSDADILPALEDRLAKFKRPKKIVFVDSLPRNAMGKVQKNLLRETFANLYVSAL